MHTCTYNEAVDFEWDEAKRALNRQKHGLDFADVAALFDRPYLSIRSDRAGEERYLAIGDLDGRILAVVYTLRAARWRLISARRARPYEEAAYQAFLT